MERQEVSTDQKRQESRQILAGKYRLEELIGEGGWGKIYRATQVEINRQVAVKMLALSHTRNETALRRFAHEARVIASLHHPNIVSTFDFGVSDTDQPFMVMELVQGISLSQLIEKGPMPEARALPLFIQLCDALAAAHKNGILHRDIKPSNVVIATDATGRDTAMLLDFGLAKVTESDTTHITSTGTTVGTPGYMSPEQYTGQQLTPAADIYSLGCLMYETLSGKAPFQGDNAVDLIQQSLYSDPKPFNSVCPGVMISKELEFVVQRTLEKFPEDRYAGTEKLRSQLNQIATGEAIHWTARCARVCDSVPRSLRRHRKKLAVASVCAIGAACALFLMPLHEEIRYHPTYQIRMLPKEYEVPPDYGLVRCRQSVEMIAAGRACDLMVVNLDKTKPADADSLSGGAYYLWLLHRSTDAEKVIRKSIADREIIGNGRPPDRLGYEWTLVDALAEQGRTEEAKRVADNAERNMRAAFDGKLDRPADATVARAEILRSEHKYADAATLFSTFDTSQLNDKEKVWINIRWGEMLSRTGHYDEAIARLNLALAGAQRESSIDDLMCTLAQMVAAEQRAGHVDKALDYSKRAIDTQPGDMCPDAIPFVDILRRTAVMLREKHCYSNAAELEKQAADLARLTTYRPTPLT
jgi:serine/threonine-protein kinase